MGNSYSAASSCRRPDVAKDALRFAEAGDANALHSILEDDARLVSHYSVFGGNSAWHKAAKAGHVAVLDALEAAVLRQYELDSKDLSETLKPCVLRLGSTGADAITRLINKSNVKGLTPLMLACSGNHTDVVSWLIKHGADVWKHDRVRRHTALHCAAEVGATDAIRLLLAHAGTEEHPGNHRTLLEQGNHAGLTALHYAVHCEQQEVVAQLLAQDADITAQAEFPDLDWGCVNAGDTAMHIAAHKGNIDAIQIMLKAYNEKSGAFLPSQDSSRRLRDPRAMRNDYGRLPYHLAMRKGLTWLGEMLDPSVPVRFLLTDQQLDDNTAWGPPRLATIAAAVLHRSLVSDLKAIQAAQQSRQPGQADRSVTDDKGLDAAAANGSPQQQQVMRQQVHVALQRDTPASISPSEEAASTTSANSAAPSRRRWGRPGHRRANSDAAGSWVARLSDMSPRASSAGRRPSAGGIGRNMSRRGRASSPAAAVAASLLTVGGDRMNLQETLGPLSPRAIVAAIVGSGGEAAASSSTSSSAVTAAAGDIAPAPAVGSSPVAGATWRRLVTRQVRLGSRQLHSQQHTQQHQVMCASPELDECCPAQPQPGASDELQPEAKAACGLVRSASDSFCLVLDDEQDWAKLAEGSGLEAGSKQQQQQEGKGSDGIPAVFDTGKVSPFPELKPELPDAVLEGLLEQYMAELCNSSAASPGQAPSTHHQACSIASSDDGQTCGVCLDAAPTAMINPCEHTMCAECALDMCERCPLGTAMCPFCRCIIKSFVPANTSLIGAAPAGKPAITADTPVVSLPVC